MTDPQFTELITITIASYHPEHASYLLGFTEGQQVVAYATLESTTLEDAKRAYVSLWKTGGIPKYDWSRTFELIRQRASEIAYETQHREETAKRSVPRVHAAIRSDPIMSRALRATIEFIREHNPSDDERRKFVDQWIDSNDDSDDRCGPRFSCHLCEDTGLRRSDDNMSVGHCGCRLGESMRDKWLSTGRVIGPASRRVTQFDDWNAQ